MGLFDLFLDKFSDPCEEETSDLEDEAMSGLVKYMKDKDFSSPDDAIEHATNTHIGKMDEEVYNKVQKLNP